MKTLILPLLLFALIACQGPDHGNFRERHRHHMHEMRDKIKACVLANANSSETLKGAFTENNDTPIFSLLGSLKKKLQSSDKEILRECRKEAFKTLRKGKFNHFGLRQKLRDQAKSSVKSAGRNLEQADDKQNFGLFKKRIFACIEESDNVTENLKKLVNEFREEEFRKFNLAAREKLNEDELGVIKRCRRESFNQLKLKDSKGIKNRFSRIGKKGFGSRARKNFK